MKFTLVALFGLALDISLAWLLVRSTFFNLYFATFISFMFVALINYVFLELWVFKKGQAEFSFKRIVAYYLSLMISLAVRLGSLFLLKIIFKNDELLLLLLILSAGLSFLLNYIINKFIVFKRN